jgi:ribosomal protein S15P/S13E
MEHLLCECENYSEPLWGKFAEALTRLFRNISQDDAPRVDLGQTNIIFNIPHPSLLLHVRDEESRNALLLLVQEIKRDIIYRRMNLPPSANQIIDPMRLTAHLCSEVRRLHSYLQYIGFIKYAKASETLQRLQDLLVD